MRTRGTVTILFTDLVASTELLARLGDDAADALRERHFGLLRDAIGRAHGREVKSVGDGIMAVFDSARDAIACAATVQRSADDLPEPGVAIRVGIHAGEPLRDRDDYFGMAVVIAARLCGAADGGQILVSGLVRELLANCATITFCAAGERRLKGIERPCAVYEVDWRTAGATAEEAPREVLRVLIADDHPVFRSGLKLLLDPVEHIEVVGEVDNGDAAVTTAAELDADVVVMDLQMGGMSGVEATRALRAARPQTGVLVLTMFEDDASVYAAMRAGARGYVLKGADQARIVHAITSVGGGEAVFGEGVAERMIAMLADAAPSGAHTIHGPRRLALVTPPGDD